MQATTPRLINCGFWSLGGATQLINCRLWSVNDHNPQLITCLVIGRIGCRTANG